MNQNIGASARLGVKGVLTYKDSDGNILKRVPFVGSVPLEGSGLTAEQAAQLPIERIPHDDVRQ